MTKTSSISKSIKSTVTSAIVQAAMVSAYRWRQLFSTVQKQIRRIFKPRGTADNTGDGDGSRSSTGTTGTSLPPMTIAPVPVDQTYVNLSSGTRVPQLAFGVGAVGKERWDDNMYAKIRLAIKNGYRHFDAAEKYRSSEELGKALSEALTVIPREEFFITTKLHPRFPGSLQDPEASLHRELQQLGLDYVDLFIIHNPFFAADEFEELWRKMELLKMKGLTREIGVSNFGVAEIEKVMEIATVRPIINQIEMHPYLYDQDKELMETCAKHGIAIAGYSPLVAIGRHNGGPVVPVIERIALAHSVSTAQVLLKWQISKGFIVITSSANSERQKQQLDLLGFDLSEDEVRLIEEIGATYPFRFFGWGAWKPEYTGTFARP